MILYIDTTTGTHISIALAEKTAVLAHRKIKAQYKQSEKLLPAIDKLLSKVQKNVDLKSIKGIVVVSGPGPFTATRIGVATANALAYALRIKIVSLQADEFENIADMAVKGWEKLKIAKKNSPAGGVEPVYDREPNITISE